MNRRSHNEWKAIIKEWEKTDFLKTEFCQLKNLSIKSFSYHFYKQQKTNGEKALDKKSFAKVVCKDEASMADKAPVRSDKAFLLHLKCGGYIEIPSNFDKNSLSRLLKMVVKL